jgi:hypothetical protein
MPTAGGQMIHRVPQDDAGAAAAPASAPLLSALDASAALAQGPSPQGPPPASAPAASVAASAGPAGRPAEGGSSSIDIGGLPDASDLSVHLWALLQAQVNALQPLVHASQQVATSFARELAPLMQMQSPSRAGGPQLPAPPFVAPQTLQGELPMPPALQMLQELQQLQQLQQLQPAHRALPAQQQPHEPPLDAEEMLRRALHAQQTLHRLTPHAPNAAPFGCGVSGGGCHLMPMVSPGGVSFVQPPTFCTGSCQHVVQGPIVGVSAPLQDPGAAIPVHATTNPLPYAYGMGDGGTGNADETSGNANAPPPTQDPRSHGPGSA